MRSLLQDARHGARMLRKSRGFTTVVTLVLSIAIGANVAIFSVVETVLLRPLPYERPDELAIVFGTNANRGTENDPVSPPDFEDWRARTTTFSELAAASYWTFNLKSVEGPQRILGARTSGNLLSMFGARAVLGRLYTPEDDRPGAEPVAVLGYGLWKQRFGGDPGVLGKTLSLNDVETTVVGVLDPTFQFPDETAEVWAPLANELEGTPRNARMLITVGRLAPGVTVDRAQSELASVTAALAAEYPDTNEGRGARVASLHDTVVGETRPALLLLQLAVALVLVVASANVTNLMLARATARRRELAVRAALGAGRWRLVRQLLIESLLLSGVAGVVGCLLAVAGVRVALAFAPNDIPRLDEVALDPTVLAFALAVTAFTGLVAGIGPALMSSRRDLVEGLKASGPTATSRRSYARDGLVVAEIAVSLVLLVGGGLLVASFVRVAQVDLGFRPDNVLTAQVFLTGNKYRELRQQREFVSDVVTRMEALPGVESVGSVSHLPLGGPGTSFALLDDERRDDPSGATSVDYRAIHQGYFGCMGIRLIEGRGFSTADDDRAPGVVVVNETLARRMWPGESAVGKRIRWTTMPWDSNRYEVVGVVGNVRTRGLESEEEPALYAPYTQRTIPFLRWMVLTVHTTTDAAGFTAALREQVHAVDPDQPVYDVKTMEERVDRAVAPRRFTMFLVGVLSTIGLLLATIGLYGVVSYSVSQRVPEIGTRIALGAQRRHIFGLVARRGMALVTLGVGLGLACALSLTGLTSGVLFGVDPSDPTTLAVVAALLVASSALACFVPARRATRVDPIVALKTE